MKTYLRDGRAPIPDKELTSRIMSSIRSKDTKPELILRKFMWSHGIKGYRLHWKKVPGKPDIAFPGEKIAIFINGCYWHRCPYCKLALPKSNSDFWAQKFEANIVRDKLKINQLENMDWKVLTVWECEIKKDVEHQVNKIRNILNKLNLSKWKN